jgi:hypothetical protein
LFDIAEISNDQAKTYLESWFDVLKKVMHMWENGASDFYKKSKVLTTKSGFFQKDAQQSDADDFYVFIYDEEDRQPQT